VRLTAALLDVHLPDDIPEHANLPLYAPDFRLRAGTHDTSDDEADEEVYDDDDDERVTSLDVGVDKVLTDLEARMQRLGIDSDSDNDDNSNE
jgi:hypothetical protein